MTGADGCEQPVFDRIATALDRAEAAAAALKADRDRAAERGSAALAAGDRAVAALDALLDPAQTPLAAGTPR